MKQPFQLTHQATISNHHAATQSRDDPASVSGRPSPGARICWRMWMESGFGGDEVVFMRARGEPLLFDSRRARGIETNVAGGGLMLVDSLASGMSWAGPGCFRRTDGISRRGPEPTKAIFPMARGCASDVRRTRARLRTRQGRTAAIMIRRLRLAPQIS
jgi:hypothetical protein